MSLALQEVTFATGEDVLFVFRCFVMQPMPICAEHVRNLHVGWVAAGSRMILGYDDEEVKHSVKMREAFEYAKTRHLRPHEEPILMSITIAEQEDLCMQIPESLPL